MASPLSEAREAVAAALASTGVPVYAGPVENPKTPCIQISTTSQQWISNQRLGGAKADVRVNVRISVPVVSGNAEALVALEDLVWSTLRLIPIAGTVGPPRVDTSGQVHIYLVDFPTVIMVSD